MSLRGVRQLKELVIRYSDLDGSSRGVRSWMQQNLVKFAAANPNMIISTDKKRSKHPCITGRYANGNTKVIGIKNLDEEGVERQILHLRNQIGRRVRFFFLLLLRYDNTISHGFAYNPIIILCKYCNHY